MPTSIRRFSINVASLFCVQIANYLLPLLTVPYVSRIIGPERFGLLNFSQTYIYYFTLLISYEFDVSAVRTVAANRGNKELINQTFNEIVFAKLILWVISTILFISITCLVPEFRAHFVLHLCTYLLCIGTVFFPVWMYQAMEDLQIVAFFNLTVKLLTTFGVLFLIRQPDDYIYQNLSLSIAQIFVGMATFGIALRKYKIKLFVPDRKSLIARYTTNSTLFFSSVATTLYTASSVFLLGLLSSDYSVGIYSAGIRLEAIVRSFISLALYQALFPVVVSAFGVSREKGLLSVQTIFFPLLIVTTIVSVSIWFSAPIFIRLLYGEKFIDAIQVLRIICILPVVTGIGRLLGLHTMINLHFDKAFFIISSIGAIIGVITSVVLIRQMDFLGASYAWVFTEIIVTLLMWSYLTHKGVSVVTWQSVQLLIPTLKNKMEGFLNR